MLEVFYAMPNFVRLGFHPPPGLPKMVSFFFVCFSSSWQN